MTDSLTLGVSVVICCYNSALRLPETLKHLLLQDVPHGLPWEVIIVDNASTDNTREAARSLWPKEPIVPLRIVYEPRPGLMNARKRGLGEAKYEFVCFVDDDNWLAPNWVKRVYEILMEHPEVGACGGRTEAVFESKPPFWFERFKDNFVVGEQGEQTGDITWSRGHLWGAGLSLRKRAWEELTKDGYRFRLKGREGNLLTSGEDYELCYALRLAGWQLWYDPHLVLKHYMSSARLNWQYLRRLRRGFGASSVGHDPYIFVSRFPLHSLKKILGRIWVWQLFRSAYILTVRNCRGFLLFLVSPSEGDADLLHFDYEVGRFIQILRLRRKYDQSIYAMGRTERDRIEGERNTMTAELSPQNCTFDEASSENSNESA